MKSKKVFLPGGPALRPPRAALQRVYDVAFDAAAFDQYGEGDGYRQDYESDLREDLERVRKHFGLKKGVHGGR